MSKKLQRSACGESASAARWRWQRGPVSFAPRRRCCPTAASLGWLTWCRSPTSTTSLLRTAPSRWLLECDVTTFLHAHRSPSMHYRALITSSYLNTTGELTMGGKTLDSEKRFRYLSQSAYSGGVGLAG